jgi:2-keto-4-pentenoate hydratase/2-oxohepta-3-ene-1,7-dioic acid hydratase in catechol pathway
MPDPQNTRFALATIEEGGRPGGPAVLTERGVLALSALLGADAATSIQQMLPDWERWCDRIAAALDSGVASGWQDVHEVLLAPPLPAPGSLYLTGANYYDHIAEMKAQLPDKAVEDVFHFMIPATSLVGDRHDVVRPPGVEKLDWEVELAAVIGRRAVDVKAENALDHVAGYTVANDVSSRDMDLIVHPIFGIRFIVAKGQATLTPMGPALVPARFVPDPGKLRLTTYVNDELRQSSSTDQMIWTLQEQIAFLSSMTALEPGDVILTGTPAGTAAAHGSYLADGDVMSVSVEGIGTLVNTVVGTPS